MKTSHIVCISKILTDLCFTKQRIKTKNTFVRVYSALAVKMCWQSIARVEKGTIKFTNYFKQIPVPVKVLADFDCSLESVKNCEGSFSKKYQDHVPSSFAYKLVCVDDKCTKPVVVFRGEFIEAVLKEYQSCKRVAKKHFNKNLINKSSNSNLVTRVGYVKTHWWWQWKS